MESKDPKWCPYPYRSHGHRHWGWNGPRPPRHWFFMRILFAFFWICLILIFIPFFADGHFSLQGIPRHLLWTLLVMCVVFFLLKRMFRPLRMLMRGVREISEGNLDFLFEARGRHGGIQYLAESFNHMIRRVKEMVQSKEQLLLDVSHELRSPLTRLKVALEMTPKGKHRDSMSRDIVDMETMLAEILETELLKSDHGKLHVTSVDLASQAREVARKYKNQKPGVKFIGSPKSLRVEADEARVRTVFQNVLENALK